MKEVSMYEPIRKFLEEKWGYKAFKTEGEHGDERFLINLRVKSVSAPRFVFDKYDERSYSDLERHLHPDVVGFKRVSNDLDSVGVECKRGKASDGLYQAIQYLPYFHKVYVAATNDEGKEIARRFGIGYINFDPKKREVSQEKGFESSNNDFNLNKFHEQLEPKAKTILNLRRIEEDISEKVDPREIKGSEHIFFKDGGVVLKIFTIEKNGRVDRDFHFELRGKSGDDAVSIGLHLESSNKDSNKRICNALSLNKLKEEYRLERKEKKIWLWLENKIENGDLKNLSDENLKRIVNGLSHHVNTLDKDLKKAIRHL